MEYRCPTNRAVAGIYMGRVCTVCQHPRIHDIDIWIVQGVSSGEISRRVGGLGRSSIRRHRMAGMHFRSLAPLTEEQEATVRTRVNVVVRTRSNQLLQKLQDEAAEKMKSQAPPPEPPSPPPRSRTNHADEPKSVNPPGKVLTEAEALKIMHRLNRARERREQPPGQPRGY
jgi:hypothetical protein